MRRSTMIRAVTGALLGIGLMLTTTTPAAASPSRFSVAYVHAGGAGATAVEVTGKFTWYNASVGLEDITFHLAPNHCGKFTFTGYARTVVDEFRSVSLCSGGTARNVSGGTVVLDAQGVRGGITRVQVVVTDSTHDGVADDIYRR